MPRVALEADRALLLERECLCGAAHRALLATLQHVDRAFSQLIIQRQHPDHGLFFRKPRIVEREQRSSQRRQRLITLQKLCGNSQRSLHAHGREVVILNESMDASGGDAQAIN